MWETPAIRNTFLWDGDDRALFANATSSTPPSSPLQNDEFRRQLQHHPPVSDLWESITRKGSANAEHASNGKWEIEAKLQKELIYFRMLNCRKRAASSTESRHNGSAKHKIERQLWHWLGNEDSDHVRHILSRYNEFILGSSSSKAGSLFVGSVKRLTCLGEAIGLADCDSEPNSETQPQLFTLDLAKVFERDCGTPIGGTHCYIGRHFALTAWDKDGCIQRQHRIAQSEYDELVSSLEAHRPSIDSDEFKTIPSETYLFCFPIFGTSGWQYLSQREDVLMPHCALYASPRIVHGETEERNRLPYAGTYSFMIALGSSQECLDWEEMKKMRRTQRRRFDNSGPRDEQRQQQWRRRLEHNIRRREWGQSSCEQRRQWVDGHMEAAHFLLENFDFQTGTEDVEYMEDVCIEVGNVNENDSDDDFDDDDDGLNDNIPLELGDDADNCGSEPSMEFDSHLARGYNTMRSASFHHGDEVLLYITSA